MRRFFLAGNLAQHMTISGQDARHISRVLRLGSGDELLIAAADGSTGRAKIISADGEEIGLQLLETLAETAEPSIHVYLAQGLPKSDKMDYIVQKAVELGVQGIFPWRAAHSVVQYDGAKQKSRQERWQKIAMEAAKQCGRSQVPQVFPVRDLSEVLAALPEDTAVVMLYEGERRQSLRLALQNTAASNFLLIVGPEGGFSDREAALCQKQGAVSVTLGPRILRTETAALAGVAVIMYEYGDLGG